MLEANEGLENIFENAVKEAEKRKHEYVTIEHVLLSLIKDNNTCSIVTYSCLLFSASLTAFSNMFSSPSFASNIVYPLFAICHRNFDTLLLNVIPSR